MPTILEPVSTERLRFGLFELDPVAQELRKAGVPVRIQSQPLRILLYLAQRAGTIVSREELHRTFWKPDTAVDLERSLAAAIYKIRECLDDSVTSPRFIETLSRSGYRFIAPVMEIHPDSPAEDPLLSPGRHFRSERAAELSGDINAAASTPPPPTAAKSGRLWLFGGPLVLLWLAVIGLAALLCCALAFRSPTRGSAAVHALTHNASITLPGGMTQGFPVTVTDNARVYFARSEDDLGELGVVMLNGGDTTTISLPEELGKPVADDISPDGLRLLLRNRLSTSAEQALWIASPEGQTAHQVPGVLAHASAWMPDGDSILYANGNVLYTIHENGSGNARFASLPGRPYYMRWSPDGSILRLTLRDDRTLDTTLWEIKADGSAAHQILGGWHSGTPLCCGTFLSSGDLYVFQAGDERDGSLWAMPVRRGWWERSQEPFRLAEGPLAYTSPAATHNGRRVIFTGFDRSFRLLTWSAKDHRLIPAPAYLSDAAQVEFSPDGQRVAWVRRDDGTLWRSRADGTDRVRVIGAPYRVSSMAWSPDAARLAIMARHPGAPWRILIADVQSSHIEELLRDDPHNEADPQWAAGGSSIIFGRLPPRLAEPALARALFRVDLATRRMVKLSGSDGLFSPRVSGDGRTLVALSVDQTVLRQLNLDTGDWRTAAIGHFDDPVFLGGGHALIYRNFSVPGLDLMKLDLLTHQTSSYAEGLRTEPSLDNPYFVGLLAGDAPAVSVPRTSADLYELEAPE
ncbi:MAG TPA: winged helix-turn-helix domain-containing protein [Acidobacteriaceae bacterium]|nr:winged helix-turn-helix domain-containing protein [Acidobacteriaceae bacterium]